MQLQRYRLGVPPPPHTQYPQRKHQSRGRYDHSRSWHVNWTNEIEVELRKRILKYGKHESSEVIDLYDIISDERAVPVVVSDISKPMHMYMGKQGESGPRTVKVLELVSKPYVHEALLTRN